MGRLVSDDGFQERLGLGRARPAGFFHDRFVFCAVFWHYR
jgi:hypothetical protein